MRRRYSGQAKGEKYRREKESKKSRNLNTLPLLRRQE